MSLKARKSAVYVSKAPESTRRNSNTEFLAFGPEIDEVNLEALGIRCLQRQPVQTLWYLVDEGGRRSSSLSLSPHCALKGSSKQPTKELWRLFACRKVAESLWDILWQVKLSIFVPRTFF